MARRETTYRVTDEGRDQGKTYLLTEMVASRGEDWAFRALCALAKSGIQLPEDFENMTMAALATVAFEAFAGIPWEEAKPLLDEMMECVKFVGDPAQQNVTTRALIEDDIEEIATRLMLRRRVFELHTGFFANAGR